MSHLFSRVHRYTYFGLEYFYVIYSTSTKHVPSKSNNLPDVWILESGTPHIYYRHIRNTNTNNTLPWPPPLPDLLFAGASTKTATSKPTRENTRTRPQTERPSPTGRKGNRPSVVRLPFTLEIVVWLHFLLGSFWNLFGVLIERSSKLSSDYIFFSGPFWVLF